MPTYDYKCSDCGHVQEIFHKISESPALSCEKCGKDKMVRRPGGGVGLAFHGDGFFANMYGPKKDVGEAPASGGCCPCGKNKGSCSKS